MLEISCEDKESFKHSIGSKNINQLRLDSNNTKLLVQNGVMTIRTNAGEDFYYNKLFYKELN